MAGELLIQVIDIARFRAIRRALDELDAGRALGLESRAVLNEAAISPFAHSERRLGFTALLGRILRHPELELRVFLAPRELDEVIEGVLHVLCFENGAESSLVTPVGPSWVVLDIALRVFMDFDWFRAIFDPNPEDRLLAYPRPGFEGRYSVLSREDVARVAAGLRPSLDDPIPAEITARVAARLRPILDDPIPTEITAQLKKGAEPTAAFFKPLIVAWRNGAPVYLEDFANVETLAKHFDRSVLALSQEVRAAAEGLARLAGKALSRDELTLAHTSLL